jgi:hypothetical protein
MIVAKEKKWMTLDEIMADPEWARTQGERDAREARHSAEVAKLRSEMEPEAAPLRRDLATVGLKVDSIYDLVNMNAAYPEAIPVLLRHLKTSRHQVQREGLARALSVLEAEGVAGGPILDELEHEREHDTRWALANTLIMVATPAEADRIAALAADPAYADVHERLGQALKSARRSRRAALPPAPSAPRRRSLWPFGGRS